MALSLEEVRRIAVLARLRLSEEEERTFAGQLSAILDHVRQLEELDVTAVEPMTHALAAGELPARREDAVFPSLTPEEATAAAPAREGTAFKVPRIIE
ncbi:glutamyl-tRNA(Gln) amidotransferase, C subunit [Anaeromyxobacter sp. K]|uniref:Aspartyl/glutamyl-tRNA(Asn/Gln) amidotransferase subunit C n=1 Tax=Anaeromyxobacter sp. (strain K) TaxID=447217 RepID=GATC_ANASK|nr:Asp-tRNA(Asn)/Glu-tRNA(Gln) amidotransferase subunit GatC [Anaeromyxobacter sp. K]B4UIV2.1 RecName: Full=Aspartyl/glutamyl-tRNA(Asn/Gln) amidotransferase subunit C; Short=Asp/Glu-ADT subunit C [Anaeromyxobacter sp. K]ACG75524.1 glutamyl-tRNA(Gln) amidotransferase, C subunit [Anaeromyxobacter sp. K]